jgi:Na+/H+-dicarboxylate symporter
MDIGKAFTFVFDDENWIVKILIAAAILLVGTLFSWVLAIPMLLAFAILGGYQVEIVRRVIQRDANPLPEWDNWGDLIVDGIKVIVIGIVYALPAIVVSLCLGIPAGIMSEDAPGLSSVFSVLSSCLSFIWAIVMSVVLPAAIAFFVADGELAAAFRFGDVLAFVRNNLSTYLITFVMSWVAYIIGGLGSIVCGVGALVTTPYAYMVVGHLYGQAYLEGLSQAPEPILEEEIL